MRPLALALAMVLATAAVAEAKPVNLGQPGSKGRPGWRRTIIKVEVLVPAGNLGGRTADEITKAIKVRINPFRYCYEKELNRKPDLRGKLVLIAKVDPTGKPISSKVYVGQSSLRDPALESCAQRQLLNVRFKPTGQPAELRLPLLFSSELET